MSSARRKKPHGKWSLVVVLALLVTLAGRYLQGDEASAETPPVAGAEVAAPAPEAATGGTEDDADVVRRAFAERRSDVQVTLSGEVERTLADDLEGDRHQRFVLRLSNEMTVLVAHNIDLAPRVPLDEGDTVTVYGEYEWNERGGVVHWTHDDPKGWHAGGWIRHDGRVYE